MTAFGTLKEIASQRDIALSDLITEIDSKRQHGNLSSAIRLFVLGFYREQFVERERRVRTRDALVTATTPKDGH